MMKVVNMHEAKTHLSRLVDLALAGDDIVIARRKQPLVRLTLVGGGPSRRKAGALPGLVQSMSDSFNDPLDDFEPELVPTVKAVSKRSRRTKSRRR